MTPVQIKGEADVIEVRHGVSALRDLRDGLAELAQALAEATSKPGYLVLVDAKLGRESVDREAHRFRSALRPEIAGRLHIVINGVHAATGSRADLPVNVLEYLTGASGADGARFVPLPRPRMQAEVVRVLVHQWLARSGPLTSVGLAETVGCSYRTVAAAVASLGLAVRRHRDRSVELVAFPQEAWRSLVTTNNAARSTMLYADQSGQARSPEYLARKVLGLGRADVAIGGVLGALTHCPSLDIVGAPRLDICIHAPGLGVEPLAIGKLDPALVEVTVPGTPAQLAVHYVRRHDSLFTDDDEGRRWADPVECLLDLHEARLDLQAEQFLAYLEAKGIGAFGRGP